MVRLIQSNINTREEIIFELMDIEREVYDIKYRGEFQAIRERFRQFPDMFILAYDSEKIIGYFCFIPISERLYEEMTIKGIFHDDDILPVDIASLEECYHIYLLSVAIYKQYQNTGIAEEMMEKFETLLKTSSYRKVKDVIASTVTADGEKYIRRYGYKIISDKQSLGFKIYQKSIGAK